MERKLSNSRTAVYKRNLKKVKDFLTVFPIGKGLPRSYTSMSSCSTENVPTDLDNSMDDNNDDDEDDDDDTLDDFGSEDGGVAAEDTTNDISNGPEHGSHTDDKDTDGSGDDDDGNDDDDNDGSGDDDDGNDDDDDDGNDDGHDDGNSDDDDVVNDDDDNNEGYYYDNDDDDDDGTTPYFSFTAMPNANVPLIAKRNITAKDHILSSIAMSVRHRLTYEATIDNLRWLKSIYHHNSIPTNKDELWKCLTRNNDLLKYHYYCQKCRDYLGLKNSETNELQKQCRCGACGPDNELESDLSYFIYINLTAQIQELLALPNISESLKYRFRRTKKDPNGYEDIYDGEEYKSLSDPRNFLEKWYNFSLTINTDGCQVANSSNASAWPIYAEINELPPHMRKKHMLLAAIFVDEEHPIMNNFFRPFMDELQELFTKGIKWNPLNTPEVTSRFIVTTCSLDAPARAAVACIKQFNGKFGCLYCYAEGKSLGPGKFVYPLSQCYKRLRTDAELRHDMAQAYDTRKIIRGVKNISALVALPLFNISKGIVVEAMHAVFLGVVKQHTKLLLTETKTPHYIGSPDDQKSINKFLLKIRLPSCRSRKPRPISTYLKWKASEWRNWLDYAPICLQKVLPRKYVTHLALLSEAIHHLNSDCITIANLGRCDMLLKKYVNLFQEYFGMKNMTSNMHLMTHLVEVVRNWGPIWVHEAFIFESWNKRIMDFITSPHARTNQVATRFLMYKFIITSLYDETVSLETRKFIAKLLKISIENDRINVKNRVIGLGKRVIRSPTEDERPALASVGYAPLNITCFNKMKLNAIKYERKNEERHKFCNSTVFAGNDMFGSIIVIINFEHNNETIGGIVIERMRRVNYAFSTEHINEVMISNELVLVKESEFIQPAVQIHASNKLYLIRQANCWETD